MILAARFRAGEVWLSYERSDERDDLFWKPTRTTRFRFESFSADPPAPQEVCDRRIEIAERHISELRDVGWRVQVKDGPPQAGFVGEFGRIVALDEESGATIRFERGALDDVLVPLDWLRVDTSSIQWP